MNTNSQQPSRRNNWENQVSLEKSKDKRKSTSHGLFLNGVEKAISNVEQVFMSSLSFLRE